MLRSSFVFSVLPPSLYHNVRRGADFFPRAHVKIAFLALKPAHPLPHIGSPHSPSRNRACVSSSGFSSSTISAQYTAQSSFFPACFRNDYNRVFACASTGSFTALRSTSASTCHASRKIARHHDVRKRHADAPQQPASLSVCEHIAHGIGAAYTASPRNPAALLRSPEAKSKVCGTAKGKE